MLLLLLCVGRMTPVWEAGCELCCGCCPWHLRHHVQFEISCSEEGMASCKTGELEALLLLLPREQQLSAAQWTTPLSTLRIHCLSL